jgi:hypothetical protein
VERACGLLHRVLVHRRPLLYEGPERRIRIWGLQSYSAFTDDVSESFALTPGDYLLVLALDRVKGGEVEIQAVEAPSEAA